MPKLPRKKLDPRKDSRFFNDLARGFSTLESKSEIKSFLLDLLSSTERKVISKRFQIAIMLLAGYKYEAIRKRIEVSDITIAKVSNWMNSGAEELKKVAKRIGDESEIVKKTTRPSTKYQPGDLLTPALREGVSLVAKKIAEKQGKL